MTSPYTLPDPRWVERGMRAATINFSGGQSSAYMLHCILEANGGLPPDTYVVFTNTGLEHPATLNFVHEIEQRWSVPITWLEYDHRPEAKGGVKDPKHHYRVVNHNSASRNGEPFETMIDAANYLPNPVRRKCTAQLKIQTIERWMRRTNGVAPRETVNILGIRADESRRVNRAFFEQCRAHYPMVDAGVGKNDIFRFWRAQPFRLGLPEDGRLGNCVLCFLKGRKILLANIREDPSRARWWMRQESKLLKKGKKSKKDIAVFPNGSSYGDLVKMAEAGVTMRPLIEIEDEVGVDCFCGD